MENKLGQEPAFPCNHELNFNQNGYNPSPNDGMSKRLYIATMTLQGILASPHYKVSDLDDAEFNVRKAYMLADELLKQETE